MVLDYLSYLTVSKPEFYDDVLASCEYFKFCKHEPVLYFCFVTCFRDCALEFKASYLRFLNALIATSDDLDTRMRVRVAMLRLGLAEAIETASGQMKLNAEFTAEVESFREDQREDQLQLETLLPPFLFPSVAKQNAPVANHEDADVRADLARVQAELEMQQRDFAAVKMSMQEEINRLKAAPPSNNVSNNNLELAAFQAQLAEAQKQIADLKEQLKEVSYMYFVFFD